MRELALTVSLQYEQHPFRTGELGGFFDHKRVKRLGGALGVEAQACIREALKGLANVGLHREMREKALLWKLAFRTVREPGGDNFAIEGYLVEVAAAQTLIAQVRDPIDQEPVGPFER